jgi:small subunit ribosomal protein S17
MEERTPHRKVRTGIVVSDKMDKTVVVRVDRMSKHPLYGKPVLRMKKYMAHDEANECHPGDRIMIEETRPLSRHKRWRVAEVIERAPVLGVEIKEEEA